MSQTKRSGFTLIEVVIVIAVIAILAAIAAPHFGQSMRTANEGYTRSSLGALRRALSVYYSDLEGQYPTDLAVLTVNGKYLRKVPKAMTPGYHVDSSVVVYGAAPDDTGGWVYNNASGTTDFGLLHVNCTHADAHGSIWTSY